MARSSNPAQHRKILPYYLLLLLGEVSETVDVALTDEGDVEITDENDIAITVTIDA